MSLRARTRFASLSFLLAGAASCAGPSRTPSGPVAFQGRIDLQGTWSTTAGVQPISATCLMQGRRAICTGASGGVGLTVALDDDSRRVCYALRGGSESLRRILPASGTLAYDDTARWVGGPEVAAALRLALDSGPGTRTGRAQVVAGRACSEWRWESQFGTELSCIDETAALGVTGPPMLRGGRPAPGLLLSMDASVLGGGTRLVMTATRVETRSVDDSEFASCPTR
jgi:hypothetical protein